MHLLKILPLRRGIIKEELSYFTAKDVPLGALASITVRGKKAVGLVVGKEDVREAKTALRASPFTVRKIDSIISSKFYREDFLRAAIRTAEHFIAPAGEILSALTSAAILEDIPTIKETDRLFRANRAGRESGFKHEPLVLQAEDADRITTYKNIVREEFARGQSVFICMPTIADIEEAREELARGIPQYAFIFHGEIAPRELRARWKRVLEEEHPVVIVATYGFLSLPRHDIHTFILDKEGSPHYAAIARPLFDVRMFLEHLAQTRNARFIMGDFLLSMETLFRREERGVGDMAPPKFRIVTDTLVTLADMRIYQNEYATKKFRILGDELLKLIGEALRTKRHLFLLVSRKGLYPLTVCADCGNPVFCSRCIAPVVLHREKGGNIFLCHKCGLRRNAEERCAICKSWRLTPLGIGAQNVEEVVKKHYPEAHCFLFEGDAVKTHKQARKVMDAFLGSTGGILIGTEMGLNYLPRKIPYGAIVSLDSLFSIPDFTMNERIFRILLSLRSKCERALVIQTRHPGKKIFSHALTGSLIDFYRDEIEERRALAYPPFSTFIKVTVQGKRPRAERDMENLKQALADYNPVVFPAWNPATRGLERINMLVNVPRTARPDAKLNDILRALPPSFRVEVHPRNLL